MYALVDTASARDLALVGLVATAPLVLIMVIALLRGYTITAHFTRDGKRRSRRDDDE